MEQKDPGDGESFFIGDVGVEQGTQTPPIPWLHLPAGALVVPVAPTAALPEGIMAEGENAEKL